MVNHIQKAAQNRKSNIDLYNGTEIKSIYKSPAYIENPKQIPVDPDINRRLYLAGNKLCQFPDCTIELGNWEGQQKPNIDEYHRGSRIGLLRGLICGRHNRMMMYFDRGDGYLLNTEDYERCREYYLNPPAFRYIGRVHLMEYK